ncbi:MAG: FmdB family zinc ribbon protein [Verrucomicrobiota bacterium]|nr:FmdB family zinc ribbon protein [Verrucomicrobiota bacterium]
MNQSTIRFDRCQCRLHLIVMSESLQEPDKVIIERIVAGCFSNCVVLCVSYFEGMPIYEFACPRCRKIYSFLSKRVQPDHLPTCPKCGNKKMVKEVSRFAMVKRVAEPSANIQGEGEDPSPMPDFDNPHVAKVMGEMERDMEHLDENNPRHMAHMMKKMKEIMPPGSMPKELDVAIKRLEKGEDPEKIEEDMGDVLGNLLGDEEPGQGRGSVGGGYSKDTGLYDY